VIGFEIELGLQRVNKGAEHIQQHRLATLGDDPENLFVGQRGEHDRSLVVDDARVVDSTYRLVCFVDAVGERQSHVMQVNFKLCEDGVAKSFGSNAGPVGVNFTHARKSLRGWRGSRETAFFNFWSLSHVCIIFTDRSGRSF